MKGRINVEKGNSDDMAYLVAQGEKEVIEEDGGGRNRITLVPIPH